MLTVLLDNGHGINTKGKRSPNGSLMEWQYTREIAKMIKQSLDDHNIPCILITPEDDDIGLTARSKRVNNIVKQNSNPHILISIHCNAAGSDGQWHNATGWEVFVGTKASRKSKEFANIIFDIADYHGLKMRKDTSGNKYKSRDFTILNNTSCPAVLTENMFMDSKNDMQWLLSDEGKDTITDIHVNAILAYKDYLEENT